MTIRRTACKLDSKARLVLPLFIREQLQIEKKDWVLMEIQPEDGFIAVRFSKTKPLAEMKRSSKNGWEQ